MSAVSPPGGVGPLLRDINTVIIASSLFSIFCVLPVGGWLAHRYENARDRAMEARQSASDLARLSGL